MLMPSLPLLLVVRQFEVEQLVALKLNLEERRHFFTHCVSAVHKETRIAHSCERVRDVVVDRFPVGSRLVRLFNDSSLTSVTAVFTLQALLHCTRM